MYQVEVGQHQLVCGDEHHGFGRNLSSNCRPLCCITRVVESEGRERRREIANTLYPVVYDTQWTDYEGRSPTPSFKFNDKGNGLW